MTAEGHDISVQATNDESIISKWSAAKTGYFEDPALDAFMFGVKQRRIRRTSLVHIFYTQRVQAVRQSVREFILSNSAPREDNDEGDNDGPKYAQCQVVSLGAGFDTSFLEMVRRRQPAELPCRWADVDFHFLQVRKKKHLQSHAVAHELYKSEHARACYSLVMCDVRDTAELVRQLVDVQHFRTDLPTLFFAECSLNYVEPAASRAVLEALARAFPRSAFCTFEQINPGSAFASVMCEALCQRNSPLLGLDTYPTLDSHVERFQLAGYPHVWARNMTQVISHFLSPQQVRRVLRLEQFDEWEEWLTTSTQYAMIWAASDSVNVDWLPAPLRECQPVIRADENLVDASYGPIPYPDNSRAQLQRWGHASALIAGKDGSSSLFIVSGFVGGKATRHLRKWDVVRVDLSADRVATESHCLYEASGKTGRALARVWHTVTYVRSLHALVVFGGRSSPHRAFGEVCAFNLSTNTWMHVRDETQGDTDRPSARWRHTATALPQGDTIMVCGGLSSSGACNDEMFTLTVTALADSDGEGVTIVWKRLALSLPSPRCGHSVELVHGPSPLLVLCGGMDAEANGLALRDAWTLDATKLDGWNTVGDLPFADGIFGHRVVPLSNARLTIVGGFAGQNGPNENVVELTLDGSSLELGREWRFVRHNGRHARPFATGFTAHLMDGPAPTLLLCGGGGVCYTFGSFFNEALVSVRLSQ